MTRFALRYPYFIIVSCLATFVIGLTSLVRMPVDLFPEIKMPVVIVAMFYPGMPPEQIEQDLTSRMERFLTLASGIDRMESRALRLRHAIANLRMAVRAVYCPAR